MPDITTLIQTTGLSVTAAAMSSGCGDGRFGNDDFIPDCINTDSRPLEVDSWTMTGEQFAAFTAELDVHGASWIAFDDEQRCEAVCAYAGGALESYLRVDGYEGATTGDDESSTTFETETCTLTLVMEADLVTGGSVSCRSTITSVSTCVYGRRPLGWTDAPRVITTVQHQLDSIAATERVSITAFQHLAVELARFALDEDFIHRCHAAAEDERHHVALLVGLGANPRLLPDLGSALDPTRSRFAIALHNALEGCVAETWSALLVHWQSQHAADPATRLVFGQIARDEARHAELAWDLHHALVEGLSAPQRAEIEAARARALNELARTAMRQSLAVPASVRTKLGLPDPRRAHALGHEFARGLATAA
jgi:hypothetical protein